LSQCAAILVFIFAIFVVNKQTSLSWTGSPQIMSNLLISFLQRRCCTTIIKTKQNKKNPIQNNSKQQQKKRPLREGIGSFRCNNSKMSEVSDEQPDLEENLQIEENDKKVNHL
jgi:hypothetical protein